MAELLDSLPDIDAPVWEATTVLGRLHELHHQLLGALVDLATGGAPEKLEQGWLDAFGDLLTPDEAMLLRRAASAPRRTAELLLSWRRHSDDQPVRAEADSGNGEGGGPAAAVLAIADDYRNIVASVVRHSGGDAGEPDKGDLADRGDDSDDLGPG